MPKCLGRNENFFQPFVKCPKKILGSITFPKRPKSLKHQDFSKVPRFLSKNQVFFQSISSQNYIFLQPSLKTFLRKFSNMLGSMKKKVLKFPQAAHLGGGHNLETPSM